MWAVIACLRAARFLVAGGMSEEKLCEIFEKAATLRAEGKTATVLPLKKNVLLL